METWDRYLASVPETALRLVIAGGGPLQADVVSWATGRPSVEVVGLLGSQDCAALIARAQAVILPSVCEETFGLVVVEAMAAGTAPVAPAHGPFPELITNRVDGVLFEPGNSDSLADVLKDIDSDPGRYEHYGKIARLAYEQRFDPDENARQLVGIYRFALDNPAFGRARSPDAVNDVMAKP